MKDGYYLSIYLSIDKIGNLYELISNRHDMCLALWSKEGERVELVRYWELERLSRHKHHSIPFFQREHAQDVIAFLLNKEGLTLEDIQAVWGSPKYCPSPEYATPSPYYYHSLAHLFSSLLIDTDLFYSEKILALAVDLRADNETEARREDGYPEYVGCLSDRGKVEYFNVASPALLWTICTSETGLQEGSLMALASATSCHKKTADYLKEEVMIYTDDKLLGYRIYHAVFDDLCEDSVEDIDPNFSLQDNLLSAAMKEIDRISVGMMERQISELLVKYSLSPEEVYLALSGGYGLNCPTNSYLMNHFGFKGFLGPPCMNDSGQALGIGLYMFYQNMPTLRFRLGHAFYGDIYSDDEQLYARLLEQGYIKDISTLDSDTFVEDIIRGVVVWFDGAAEIGPRALGHRSLLGDPRKIETKDELNRIKERQFWRPVAPIVLAPHVLDWFQKDIVSPYMLHTCQIRPEMLHRIPAVAHLDGTARLQTISNDLEENLRLYGLINAFYQKTGVPLLCNTSLNDRGEPIVNRPCEALHFALKKEVEIVYINGKRIQLKNFSSYHGECQIPAEIQVKLPQEQSMARMEQENPYDVPASVLIWRNIFPEHDLRTAKGAQNLIKSVDYLYKRQPIMKRVFDL